MVGVAADVTVGHTASHPHGTLLEVAFAGDFEYPHLVGVGKRETFAAVGIAVGLYQLCHNLDGLAAVLGALQGKIDKVAVVYALGVAFVERADAAPGGLAYGQLVFVDEAYHVVGVCRLRNLNLELEAAIVV